MFPLVVGNSVEACLGVLHNCQPKSKDLQYNLQCTQATRDGGGILVNSGKSR